MQQDADVLPLKNTLGRPASDTCKQAGYMLKMFNVLLTHVHCTAVYCYMPRGRVRGQTCKDLMSSASQDANALTAVLAAQTSSF